jgi:hypothetical protein
MSSNCSGKIGAHWLTESVQIAGGANDGGATSAALHEGGAPPVTGPGSEFVEPDFLI